MGLTETSVALAGCVLVLVVAIIIDRRPYHPGKLNYIALDGTFYESVHGDPGDARGQCGTPHPGVA